MEASAGSGEDLHTHGYLVTIYISTTELLGVCKFDRLVSEVVGWTVHSLTLQ